MIRERFRWQYGSTCYRIVDTGEDFGAQFRELNDSEDDWRWVADDDAADRRSDQSHARTVIDCLAGKIVYGHFVRAVQHLTVTE